MEWMRRGVGLDSRKYLAIPESKKASDCIPVLKTMNTIPIRPLLTLKLVMLGALALLALLPRLI